MKFLSVKTLGVFLFLCATVVMLLHRIKDKGGTLMMEMLEHTELKRNMDQSLLLPAFGVVNVMEEHHEALMYWFSAAASGAIKKQGNILLHIDGHSDAAFSEFWRKMPLFRLPSSQKEVKLMMEANDVFIPAAAATGLINRFIWVWPPYDAGGYLHDNNEPYVSVRLRAGIMYREGKSDEDEHIQELCACAESDNITMDTKCAWVVPDFETGEDSYVPIPESECLDKTLSGIVEFVSTKKAIELARSGNWIRASDSVILDIDEDFYACEAVSATLYNAGMSQDDINDISSIIQKLLCVDNAQDEMLADKFFHDMLMITLKHLKLCNSLRAKGDSSCSDSLSMRNAVIGKLYNELQKTMSVMCLPSESTHFMLRRLIDKLLLLNERQLEELITVGVCMNQSPRTTSFKRNDGMMLCKGKNGPNSTFVVYHSVNEEEIDQTTNHLKTILSQPFTPGVVTLVRSVRDGYTPRKHFHLIESKILNVLKTIFPHPINEGNVHYDSELLGGKEGWYFRHTKIRS
ncbi:uncharacterized protein [Haliotis asinina]|uniref:uncharacterized protein n=1 Tax=Haliotis asinina TaxID=109174 RepID=UPI0035322CB6